MKKYPDINILLKLEFKKNISKYMYIIYYTQFNYLINIPKTFSMSDKFYIMRVTKLDLIFILLI